MVACDGDSCVQGDVKLAVTAAELVVSGHKCNRVKTKFICSEPAKAQHVFGATVATDSVFACGTPLGSQRYVKDFVNGRCEHTASLMGNLAGLQLHDQMKEAVLFVLQHKEAHRLRNTEWSVLRDELPAVEASSLHTLCQIISITDLNPHDQQQALLPYRHGGMGLQHYCGWCRGWPTVSRRCRH